ncbi:hypothetical protein HDU76_000222 [Blyttiomyces sp. JEL0837]|nr:hypothetical protein HDU76_000222 [Blyttiomyces sp. JEL0837]
MFTTIFRRSVSTAATTTMKPTRTSQAIDITLTTMIRKPMTIAAVGVTGALMYEVFTEIK